ncbi:hypothetical protein TKK_0016966 [Trichogramma kaykai]|uniref:Trafficking protein particle complex subunit 11 domain-containing protein n=1 Tax=Trichogramma kaykai TaxID=54128 RepID=A0ABD2W5K8_9HYME
MNFNVRVLICKRKSVYDDYFVSVKHVYNFKEYSQSQLTEDKEQSNNEHDRFTKYHSLLLRRRGLNAYLVSVYLYTIIQSTTYRKAALHRLERFVASKEYLLNDIPTVIFIRLKTPKHQFLDFEWNKRMTRLVIQKHDLDVAMSWLSTLGGAFSALGDEFNHCAKVAGKISLAQFKLSLQLGDPQLVARCNLYAALSLIQQGYYKRSKQMIQKIYKFALESKDVRLQKMCQGVWAKLKYCYLQRKKSVK